MAYKSILCIFGGEPFESKALALTMGLASAFKANLRCMQIALPLSAHPELCGTLLYGDPANNASRINSLTKIRPQDELRRQVAAAAERYAVEFEPRTENQHSGAATFIPVTGLLNDCISIEGRSCDLVVAGRRAVPVGRDLDVILAALFTTGKSVLVVPEAIDGGDITGWLPQIIAIAWDGSLEATHAVESAMPLIEKAKKVVLFFVGNGGPLPSAVNEDGVKTWLNAHGIEPDFRRIGHYDSTFAEAIIACAGAVHADLLVMGAYGHGHVNETLLGGITEHVLHHCELPILMAN